MGDAHRGVAALAMIVVLLGGSVVAVSASYGAFEEDHRVHGTFPRAGLALVPGADVQYRGVTVGEVTGIELVDRRARISMSIDPGARVPRSVIATVRPKTLFGEKFIDLSQPEGGGSTEPLSDGDEITRTGTATEVEDVIAGSVPLLEEIDPGSLATVVHELALATRGAGDDIASSLESGARLAALLADTIGAQTVALDSWARFQAELAPTGPAFNEISSRANVALPTLNRAAADFRHMLRTLRPLAEDLAAVLRVHRPDIDALLTDGDNVLRVFVSHRRQLSETIHGLYRYAFKFGEGASPETLPDGSKMAYFKVFLLLQDLQHLVCGPLAPVAGDARFGPLRQALAASPLECEATFAALTGDATGDVPAPADLLQRIADGTGEPDRSERGSLADYLRRLLEGS